MLVTTRWSHHAGKRQRPPHSVNRLATRYTMLNETPTRSATTPTIRHRPHGLTQRQQNPASTASVSDDVGMGRLARICFWVSTGFDDWPGRAARPTSIVGHGCPNRVEWAVVH